ncbi:MAG TPA: DUF2662 domain-containing protein [Acidimicrobiia bacterium]|jgi:hypothetical protein|nr:DUF2662 domain-containing protein [Acidimicrobiia bacterium]HIL47225.1 DUF2662 domain-containing protein [Acidimicrobiia bacterium]
MTRHRVERRLEAMVEGTFARLFKSGLRPVEVGRRLVRVLEAHRSVGVDGKVVVPNHFTVHLSPPDAQRFEEIDRTLKRELTEAVRQHAQDEGYRFAGPVEVDLITDDQRRTGTIDVVAIMREDTAGAAGSLVNTAGQRRDLTEQITTLGRNPESTIILMEKAASRDHAEIHRRSDGVHLIDKGSTNGTWIGDHRIVERQLNDGDEIRIGTTVLRFDAS